MTSFDTRTFIIDLKISRRGKINTQISKREVVRVISMGFEDRLRGISKLEDYRFYWRRMDPCSGLNFISLFEKLLLIAESHNF